MANMLERVRTLCRSAAESNLRIMIDAEHQYFQPAIDSIAKDMMREFNSEVPIVFNTYQCYLKDSRFRLNADVESARRQGYKFGAKLVRGAYMVLERGLASAPLPACLLAALLPCRCALLLQAKEGRDACADGQRLSLMDSVCGCVMACVWRRLMQLHSHRWMVAWCHSAGVRAEEERWPVL